MATDALGPLIVDLDGDLSLARRDRDRLRSSQIGGVILFSRNHESGPQLHDLVAEIKGLRAPALLVTVDQEGGRVQRFRGGFTRLPPAAVCGRIYDDDQRAGERLAFNIGLVMAAELLECGVDLSFAPVMDVLRCDSRVIGDRAFHSDPEVVQALASSYIAGMHAAGMACVGKHYPGHGGTDADSHTCLPEDARTIGDLRACDLRPFSLLASRLQGVMLAHVLYPNIDAQIPSYSSFWVRDVLRAETGFRGAVFSDDLSMAGAGDGLPVERCRAALRAGCDLLPICNDRRAVDELLCETAEKWMSTGAEAAIQSLYPDPKPVDRSELDAARETVGRAAFRSP